MTIYAALLNDAPRERQNSALRSEFLSHTRQKGTQKFCMPLARCAPLSSLWHHLSLSGSVAGSLWNLLLHSKKPLCLQARSRRPPVRNNMKFQGVTKRRSRCRYPLPMISPNLMRSAAVEAWKLGTIAATVDYSQT
jgi:hypothetical protein